MRAWAPLYLLAATAPLAACSFEHGRLATDGGTDSDASDGRSCTSFSTQVDTCKLAPTDMDLVLSGTSTYDTMTGVLMSGSMIVPVTHMQMMGGAGPIDVVRVRDFHVTANAKLRATGPVPLAILAWGTVTLDAGASIDVGAGGAGGRMTCPSGPIMGMPRNGGAGGGGGGGFGAAGGDGGNGDADGTQQAPGGPGGQALGVVPAGPLGGCPGAAGGNGSDDGGPGGVGGGAIYIASAMRIDLASSASITAGGGGGEGGRQTGVQYGDAGGGGGGSGGMIMLESPIVRSMGTLAANGGGGGEGSGNGNAGNAGANGIATTTAAPGGNGGSPSGVNGGAGGAQAAPAGVTVTAVDNGGGGGGGGGVGFIVMLSADKVVMIASPNPS